MLAPMRVAAGPNPQVTAMTDSATSHLLPVFARADLGFERGEGVFDHEDRQKAMRFAFQNAGVDCVTVGYKSPAEVDEAITNLNAALA